MIIERIEAWAASIDDKLGGLANILFALRDDSKEHDNSVVKLGHDLWLILNK